MRVWLLRQLAWRVRIGTYRVRRAPRSEPLQPLHRQAPGVEVAVRQRLQQPMHHQPLGDLVGLLLLLRVRLALLLLLGGPP